MSKNNEIIIIYENKPTIKDVYFKHRFRSYIGYPVSRSSRFVKVRRNSNVRGIIKGVFVALGKVPEHQRADRDNYVKILWDNIERGNCIYIY